MIYLALTNLLALGALLYVLHAHATERAELLNRIQAPDRAVEQSIARSEDDSLTDYFQPFDLDPVD